MSFSLSPEVVTRVFNPGMSIRNDFNGVKARILRRGGRISEKEFGASFPIGIEVLADQAQVPSLTVHHHKRSNGNPLVTLVTQPPEGLTIASDHTFDLNDLKDRISGVARALTTPCAVPIRKRVHGQLAHIVVYAVAPSTDPS